MRQTNFLLPMSFKLIAIITYYLVMIQWFGDQPSTFSLEQIPLPYIQQMPEVGGPGA